MSTSDAIPAIHADKTLDARGLSCPLPILKTKVELAHMAGGEVLRVLATDPLAVIDFRAFCLRTEHELLHFSETEKQSEFYIRKADPGQG